MFVGVLSLLLVSVFGLLMASLWVWAGRRSLLFLVVICPVQSTLALITCLVVCWAFSFVCHPLELIPLLFRQVVPARRALLVEFLDLLVDQLARVLALVLGPGRLHEPPISHGLCGV